MPRFWPLKKGTYTISSRFAGRTNPVTGRAENHSGTDFAARDGTPFYACAGGTVQYIGPASGYGQWIVIDHPASEGGGCSEYGHMWNSFATGLKLGDRVKAGQLIGYVGSNGQSTGPHLHLTVWEYGHGGRRIDPETWLRDAAWPESPTPPVQPPPSKGPPVQPSTTYTQLTNIDRGPRDPGTVPLIAIHTYECPRESGERALRNRANYQQTSGTGSYNVLVSADGKSLRANDDNYTPCASLPTGDRLGFHLSFLAYAADSRETWLKHDAQLREAARICAQWCRNHGHEVRRLSVPEVQGRRVRGFCSHGDISVAFRESTHTDPGKNFPWDVFLRYVTEHMTGTAGQGKDWLAMATEADLRRIVREEIAAYCGPIGHDVKRLAVQMGMDADDAGFGKVPGWKQTGHRSFIDSVAAVGAQLGVPRMTDTLPELPAGARNPKLKG
ncbi:M23 family metallopeptidase [Dietzia maris]|uniref:M23 family metallopeptidase n=1 Tax=Dietzia maris TaxID=37915 RepID=A0AAE4QXK7_9ACTN|nr:M23 family metallopeptidase [Dietzia maris]MDV6300181.1 M23 family metallopeptidase [Dietzia maris]